MGAIVFLLVKILCHSVLVCPTSIYPRCNFILLSRHFLSRKKKCSWWVSSWQLVEYWRRNGYSQAAGSWNQACVELQSSLELVQALWVLKPPLRIKWEPEQTLSNLKLCMRSLGRWLLPAHITHISHLNSSHSLFSEVFYFFFPRGFLSSISHCFATFPSLIWVLLPKKPQTVNIIWWIM